MKPTVKTKLLRFFEDNDITRAEIAERTGIAAGYLRNMFGEGSDPLTDSAKYKIVQAFPGTIAILLPVAEQERRRSRCIDNLPDGRDRQLVERAAKESGLPVFCKDVARDKLGCVLLGYFSIWTEAYHEEHAPFWDAYRRLRAEQEASE